MTKMTHPVPRPLIVEDPRRTPFTGMGQTSPYSKSTRGPNLRKSISEVIEYDFSDVEPGKYERLDLDALRILRQSTDGFHVEAARYPGFTGNVITGPGLRIDILRDDVYRIEFTAATTRIDNGYTEALVYDRDGTNRYIFARYWVRDSTTTSMDVYAREGFGLSLITLGAYPMIGNMRLHIR